MMVWRYLRVGGALLGLALVAGILFAWRASWLEQAQLQAELKATLQALAEANDRQKTRDATLTMQLTKLSQQKAAIQKPEQIISALPGVLPLPIPLSLWQEAPMQNPAQADQRTSGAVGSLPISAPSANVTMPAEDLKPMYDFAVDCKGCQLRLATAQADLKDEQTKTKALGRERDDALRAARGGSIVKRVVRAAKWFVIGAAAGAVAVRLTR